MNTQALLFVLVFKFKLLHCFRFSKGFGQPGCRVDISTSLILFHIWKNLWVSPSSCVQNSPQNTLTETFELFYGQNRKAGQRMVNSYCKSKHHLQVPKPEQFLLPKADLGLNLPPLRELPQLKATMQVIFGRYLLIKILIFNFRRRSSIGSFVPSYKVVLIVL